MRIDLKKVTSKDVQNFVEGTYQYYRPNTPSHIQEQAEYRAYLCHPCLINKSCLRCGCSTPAMFFAPHKIDSDHKWDKMLPIPDWERFKETSEEYARYLTYRKYHNPLDPNSPAPVFNGNSINYTTPNNSGDNTPSVDE